MSATSVEKRPDGTTSVETTNPDEIAAVLALRLTNPSIKIYTMGVFVRGPEITGDLLEKTWSSKTEDSRQNLITENSELIQHLLGLSESTNHELEIYRLYINVPNALIQQVVEWA